MIPDSFIQKVKDMNDIVDVLGQFIHLEIKGKNAWACCPFHIEKTPSFCVSLDTQIYKCFGCGERGNVFSFLMKHQHMTFVEAIEYLAKRVNLEVPRDEDPKEAERRKRRETLLACLKSAARFYFDRMNSKEGQAYLSYWYGRGLSADTIRYFGLGASTDFDGVIKHLESKGFDKKTILAAGIAEEKNGRILDAEHHRAIVPIFDQKGAVVAFGGRILDPKGFAKYKNTPGTEVFFKSLVLYNLNRFREQGTRTAIIVEGYMDVIALYQAGFTNAVAPMGTSFTDEQCTALKRYADTVYVSFDGDAAGRKATLTAIDKLRKHNFEIRVVTEPDELDPDEVIKKFGAEGYQKCLDESLPWIDYKLKTIEQKYDLKSLDGRSKYAKAAAAFLEELDIVTREIYLDKVAERADIAREAFSQYFKGIPERKTESASLPAKKIPPTQETGEKDKLPQSIVSAERFVLAAFLRLCNYEDLADVSENYFHMDSHKKVYDYILRVREKMLTPRENDVFDLLLNDSEAGKIFDEYEAIPPAKITEQFRLCVNVLKSYYLNKRTKELSEQYRTAANAEEREKIKEELRSLSATSTEERR